MHLVTDFLLLRKRKIIVIRRPKSKWKIIVGGSFHGIITAAVLNIPFGSQFVDNKLMGSLMANNDGDLILIAEEGLV